MTRYQNISLKNLNSFGVEATASELFEYKSIADLTEIFRNHIAGRPWMVLSGGNNILFTRDYDGVLLHPTAKGVEIAGEKDGRTLVRVQAGTEWDDVVEWCVGQGLWGIENLSLIPGYAGAAPVQNIGAYGVEACEVIDHVEVFYTGDLSTGTIDGKDCAFGYRDSAFKRELRGRAIITAVVLSLSLNPAPNIRYGQLCQSIPADKQNDLAAIRRAVIEVRRGKLPDPAVTGNAGSFFKNPEIPEARAAQLAASYPGMPLYPAHEPGLKKLAAGWLIDQAGWKGRTLGNAGVHPQQALVLVNATGRATGAEVMALAVAIIADVEAKFGITLEMEVNVI